MRESSYEIGPYRVRPYGTDAWAAGLKGGPHEVYPTFLEAVNSCTTEPTAITIEADAGDEP